MVSQSGLPGGDDLRPRAPARRPGGGQDDPKPKRIEPEQTNRAAGPAPKVHGRAETRRTEAERIEQVGNLGRAYDKAQGNPAALLAVAEDAERLGFADLARRYRQAAG